MNINKLDLEKIASNHKKAVEYVEKRIIICAGGCAANGALTVLSQFQKEIENSGKKLLNELDYENLDNNKNGVYISQSGCQGFCQAGPLVHIMPDNILYTKVKKEDVKEIVQKTIVNNETVERLLFENPETGSKCRNREEIPFYRNQQPIILKESGSFNPEDIREYIANGGYQAAEKAFLKMSDKDICDEITFSGLRGRGGGGFPTGKKMEFTRLENNDKKYVICNGDEGDPGAFMDRSVMEGNPHAVVEGMMIEARGIGADEGYVYVRMEYPLAVRRMRKAIEDAEKWGILGEDVFGSGKSLKLHVMEGAGAFVCGEETALMSSIEGNRGMPKPKPPFPSVSGLWGKPTIINNVETLANIPRIIRNSASEYKKIGTEKSSGTKTFALTGHVANTGLIEVPFGTTLREIVYNIGGGVTDNKGDVTGEGFKAVQIGGPSGGCLTEEHLDIPIDYDSLTELGAMVGSGGLVVMNKETCMVKVARYFMQFTQNESCGKCVPCREGTKQMLSLLDDIIEGRADSKTLEMLERVGKTVAKASLCGLGKTAPSPILSTMKYFREEYEAHVFQKRCPAGECKALTPITINQDKCVGCTACARKCPVGAISGEPKKPHVIDQEKCIKCGVCADVCKFKAVEGVA